MNLVLLEPGEADSEGLARLSGRRAAHLHQVLRAGPGDEIAVGVLGGRVGRARVVTIDAATVTLAVTLAGAPPPPLGIDLLLALPRPKTLRRLLAAVASMGVKRIVLVNAARVEKSYFASPLLSPPAIEAELRAGLEQARDTILPEVRIEPLFRPFVEDRAALLWPDRVVKLVADPAPAAQGEALSPDTRIALAIGPDGGWVDFERELLAGQGFRPFSLGPRALRVDVATIAGLAQLDLARRRPGSASST